MTSDHHRGDPVIRALGECLVSANEADVNGEPANVVDALCAIARALHRLAAAVEQHGTTIPLEDWQ